MMVYSVSSGCLAAGALAAASRKDECAPQDRHALAFNIVLCLQARVLEEKWVSAGPLNKVE